MRTCRPPGPYGEFDVGRAFPTPYNGRVSVQMTADGPDGPVSRSVTLTAARPGFFGHLGIVSDADTGLVTVEYLNDGRVWTAPVWHGAFQVAEAESLAGRFRIRLDYVDGRRLMREVTKDRARYFVALGDDPAQQAWIEPRAARMTAVPSLTTCRTRLFWARPTEAAGRLRVLDVQEPRIRTLSVIAGATSAECDGGDDWGFLAEPGVYYLRLEAGATVMNAKVVLIR